MPKQATINLKNHFLVAMPDLQNSWFKQSVVYIYTHDDTGATGLIINKPIRKLAIETVLNNFKITFTQLHTSFSLNHPIFSGGPLSSNHEFILHTPKQGFQSSINVSEKSMITTSKDILETLGTPNQPKDVLIALGYSRWSTEQLEQELLKNYWLIVPANEKILFRTPILDRWDAAAKILGINIRDITNQSGHA